MTRTLLTILAGALLLVQACSDRDDAITQEEVTSPPVTGSPADAVTAPNVVEIRAVGLTLEGPSEIPAGWTTFRFINESGMIHLVMIDVPPDGVDVHRMKNEMVLSYQVTMDAMNAGDEKAIAAGLASFPDWAADLYYMGGPGFLSHGKVSESTVYLEPGYYVLECYVKTDGQWHTYNPDPVELGMVLALNVTDAAAKSAPPAHNFAMRVSNTGFEVEDGTLRSGKNTIKVTFDDQQTFSNSLGNDVHIIGVRNGDDIAKAARWFDWTTKDGLQTPAPVIFYGGVNDMPKGATGYFTADLSPGDFAFIAEAPEAVERGYVLQFSIGK